MKTPTVPLELEHLLDDRVLGLHEQHVARSYDDLVKQKEMIGVDASNPHSRRLGGVMFGRPGADFEAGVTIHASSYLQAWKPSKAASALFLHDVVNPDGITIVLPNNSGSQIYYEFSDDDIAKMNNGDMRPFFENQVRTVERLLGNRAVGDVSISGFSQGALVGLGMAAVGSDKFSIVKANLFEAPSEERTPKKLRSDFAKSSGPMDQIRAIKDAAIPSLSESLRMDRLVKDWFRFGADSTLPLSKAIMNAMSSPKIDQLVDEAFANNDDIEMILGYIDGSRMLGEATIADRYGLVLVGIGEGRGSHGHATSDNIVANALMMSMEI